MIRERGEIVGRGETFVVESCIIQKQLDNVLVFQSWDRPTGIIAKISDFAHSLFIGSDRGSTTPQLYYGTSMSVPASYLNPVVTFANLVRSYNAPELLSGEQPRLPELRKCDMWAFGLLAWEVLLDGEFYVKMLPTTSISTHESVGSTLMEHALFLNMAKASVARLKAGFQAPFLQSVSKATLALDPNKRTTDLSKVPIIIKWHIVRAKQSTQSAAQIGNTSTTWSYEMFRLENGSEITWIH